MYCHRTENTGTSTDTRRQNKGITVDIGSGLPCLGQDLNNVRAVELEVRLDTVEGLLRSDEDAKVVGCGYGCGEYGYRCGRMRI